MTSPTYYSTPADVIQFAGLKPENVNLEDESDPAKALNALVVKWLVQIKDIIDSYCHQTFGDDDEAVPGTVESVSLRMAANMAGQAVTRRDTPLIRVNEWKVQLTNSAIFTDDLKSDLEPYVDNRSPTKTPTLGIMVISKPEDTNSLDF